LPCLATFAPAAAADELLAAVEMLKLLLAVAAGAAGVSITCSLSLAVNGSVVAISRMARAKPAISSAVSPRPAMAPSSPASSTSEASPAQDLLA